MSISAKILIAGMALCFMAVTLPVSEKDVRACQGQTGWTADRCRVELSR